MSEDDTEFEWIGDNTEEVPSTDDTTNTDDGATRHRNQYPMYLPDPMQDELNEAFKKYNANRTLDDKPEAEKHREFNEGIIRCALDNDWKSYVEDKIKHGTNSE